MRNKLPEKIANLIPLIEDGLLELFEINKEQIKSLNEYIDAISLDVIPSTYQEFFAISFRQDKDYINQNDYTPDISLRYSPADWEYYSIFNYRSCNSPKFEKAANTIFKLFEELYHSVEEYDEIQQDINHLILIAAAEALLKPSVNEKLKECGMITAPKLMNRPDGYSFEYLVTDIDCTFNFNYCEFVIANRMINAVSEKFNLI